MRVFFDGNLEKVVPQANRPFKSSWFGTYPDTTLLIPYHLCSRRGDIVPHNCNIMCTRLTSGDAGTKSQSLFEYILQQRDELHQHQQQSLCSTESEDERLSYNDSFNSHRGPLKRTMSRRGAIGFADPFTLSCCETASYFHDKSDNLTETESSMQDETASPVQMAPERSFSAAKKRCRLSREESSGSHQCHLEDTTYQFAAVAISDGREDADPEDSMERSVRRRMLALEENRPGSSSNERSLALDVAAHHPKSHFLPQQSALGTTGLNDSSTSMEDI